MGYMFNRGWFDDFARHKTAFMAQGLTLTNRFFVRIRTPLTLTHHAIIPRLTSTRCQDGGHSDWAMRIGGIYRDGAVSSTKVAGTHKRPCPGDNGCAIVVVSPTFSRVWHVGNVGLGNHNINEQAALSPDCLYVDGVAPETHPALYHGTRTLTHNLH